ncbi:type VII secretion protein EccE [Mycolicibacterium senegalense]|uniref:type VII secretion protein EccE n=1 Tax=Mycobacteriaceae TaxID=1762 RepID=UPI003AAB7DFB
MIGHRGRVQAHRTGWLRMGKPSSLIFSALATVLVAVGLGGGLPWWAVSLLAVAVFVTLFVPVRGRVLLVEWIAVVNSYLGRRRRGGDMAEKLPAAEDVEVVAGTAGVRWDGYTVVSAIELAPEESLTFAADGAVNTDSVLPLNLVVTMMKQYDLDLDIDIVSAGCHVPAGSAYRTVYSEVVGPSSLIGQRRTWLVLRLNVFDNLDDVIARGPSRTAAPKALATATLRVVQRLHQERIRAHALSVEGLDELSDILLKPIGAENNKERWGTVQSGLNFISTYVGDPAGLNVQQLNKWWSWRTEDTVVMLRLTGARAEDVQLGALVRYVTHGKAYRPPAEVELSLPTGLQRLMLSSPVPAGDRSLEVALPTVRVAELESVAVAIGPAGQLLGQADDGTAVAAALWDQSGQPQRRRVDARVGVEYARQVVLRAVTLGAVIGIHTENRSQWEALMRSVGDTSKLFYATASAYACDIAVFDGRPVTTAPARTVMRLLGPDESSARGADLTLIQVDDYTVEVAVGTGKPHRLRIVRSREEDRYLGISAPVPPPRRAVSTEPELNRAHRRREPVPRRNPERPGPRPVEERVAGGRPTRRREELAGPQRVSRQGSPAPATATEGRQPRKFNLPEAPMINDGARSSSSGVRNTGQIWGESAH